MEGKHKGSFVESIDYSETGDASIWGEGDRVTLELLERTPFDGLWLNLAAGDGRYNNLLLQKVDGVIAADVDKEALKKLRRQTPQNLEDKLQLLTFDMRGHFPLNDNSLDGVFCTGTLHLFDRETLSKIFLEISRVVKVGGAIFIDFATDIKRVMADGTRFKKDGETSYFLEEAKLLLESLLSDFNVSVVTSSVPEEDVVAEESYKFSSNFLLLSGTKRAH